MLSKVSLKARLFFAFGTVAFLVLITGVGGWYALDSVSANYSRVATAALPNVNAVSEMRFLRSDMVRLLLRAAMSNDPVKMKSYYEDFKSRMIEYERQNKAYLAIEFVPGEKELYDAQNSEWIKTLDIAPLAMQLFLTGDPEDRARAIDLVNDDLIKPSYQHAAGLKKLSDFWIDRSGHYVKAAQSAERFGNLLMLVLMVLAGAISMAIGYWFSQAVSNLLRDIIQQLTADASEVSAASTEIAATSEQLSSSAVQQASSIQETAASVEELSSMVSRNAENAARSSEIARSSFESATQGKQAVEEMMAAIGDIDTSNQEIANVVKVIAQIGNKTKVIDDIVFKTQLLSFNASVEAARAGEHGKGFAVVAEEVGNLAQMSGKAAKEISEMLDDSLEKVGQMIAGSKQKVETGIQVSRRCGGLLQELVGNVSEVTGMVDEIAGASQEQAKGISEITKAMNQLDQVTQQNASASQQAASSSEQLSNQSESLMGSVTRLNVLLHGKTKEPSQRRYEGAPKNKKSSNPGAARTQREKLKRSTGHISSEMPSSDSPGFDEAA